MIKKAIFEIFNSTRKRFKEDLRLLGKVGDNIFREKNRRPVYEKIWISSNAGFSASLKSTDLCGCGEQSSPIHNTTECPLTSSYHLTKPTTDLIQLWLQRVMLNHLFWARIRNHGFAIQE
ncbi:hypothetical protein AVEN_139980-1 [Araneus ventricosus]|uniref:Uncharacterized protein n=1 Tax=Araneus ventricosus TaxID=182803 RepID=A0A4Y2NFX8_ARAVE|nr:hypothetical protein AVEN_139980-1 [Araneus ventricosus]